MPFQVFRRHQRKMLAVLAILAMGGFILADSGTKWMANNVREGGGRDEVVATLYGRTIRESDLSRLLSERQLANGTLAQLRPYFLSEETFGPATVEEGVDAYILEHEADALGIPATAEMAKSWIFEQARQQHEFLRLLNRGMGPFEPRDLQDGLEQIYQGYSQNGQNGMTDVAFLEAIANQIRIAKVRELIAPPLVTPLDAFQAYEDSEVRVEARYAAFRAEDYLSEVPDPAGGDTELRAFYDRHKERLADPTRAGPGFRVPRRIRVEFLTLGLNAIDALKQQILQKPLAAELRAEETFAEDVARAFAEDQERPGPAGETPLPAFLFNDDPTGQLTPAPAAFVDQFVALEVDRQVEELLVEEIDAIFDGPRDAIEAEVDRLEREGADLESGRGLDEIPSLDRALAESGQRLREALGPAAGRPEGIGFTRLGLTRLLADPGVARSLIGPTGVTAEWADYFELTGLDWSTLPLRRQALNLIESRSGLEAPGINPTTSAFPEVLFARGLGLLEPQEFADLLGRRYLAVKTMDLPERSVPFESAPREVVLREWKLARARELAEEAARAFAQRVREDREGTPAQALDRAAAGAGLTTTTTGQRVAVDPPTAFAPIDASDAVREAIFSLADAGDRRAEVAADRSGDTYYVFALAARRDRSLPATAGPGEQVDYPNALGSLTYYQSAADRAEAGSDQETVMKYLRAQAGLPEDWTPPEALRSEG